jgi:hypothetical protein
VGIQLPVAHEFFHFGVAEFFGVARGQEIVSGLGLEERDHFRVSARTVILVIPVDTFESFCVQLLFRGRSGGYREKW